MKRVLALSSIGIIALALTGCGLNDGDKTGGSYNSASVAAPTKRTLHDQVFVKTFSVNYDYGSGYGSNAVPRERLDNLVNSYLQSITNLSQYNVDVRTSSNSGDDNDGSDVEVYTIVLTKK